MEETRLLEGEAGMLMYGQDPHEMCDPLHRCPALVAALREEDADAALDTSFEDALLRRHLDIQQLAA